VLSIALMIPVAIDEALGQFGCQPEELTIAAVIGAKSVRRGVGD